MITEEPMIKVGILEGREKVQGQIKGAFVVDGRERLSTGNFAARAEKGIIELSTPDGALFKNQKEITLAPVDGAFFSLSDVTIGINFHWQRNEQQSFHGNLHLISDDNDTVTAINEIRLEDYLMSVISSEMNEAAPIEFLKAHAVTSRSWLVRMLEKKQHADVSSDSPTGGLSTEGEIVRWYGREEHDKFDVCADDHCQRYQGITKSLAGRAAEAVRTTHGLFLTYDGGICDSRYYKSCGGITENYENAWDDRKIPYLRCVSDSHTTYEPIISEEQAAKWLLSSPDAYCNTEDEKILRTVLPSFDQETKDFFRWQVSYSREELESILREKSGLDFGDLCNVIPLSRGPSGRIFRLKIEGSKRTVVVGKELEIRRWLSRSHLYSSAFVISVEHDSSGVPARFIFTGGGWGHGVGMCQIGAAVMADRGFSMDDILQHYFPGTELKRLY
jgi:stage II sporulation protein D